LSEARGKIVAEYLVSQGIDASRITVKGLGALNPVAPNDTEEGRSKNRRIEFVLR
ncbi:MULTISPECIES: OmpA family protein, partial [unclassified Sulfuricurvum]|uniref:OmpA family protein n=1 Tax=unclassified Sulfuricurvum TaxID=2632390 RepID=UPI0034556803